MSRRPSSNLWLFLEAIAHRRGMIIGLVLLAVVISIVVSLLLPEWYTASALLLPPPEESSGGGLAQLAQVALVTGGVRFPGMITPNDVFARMLRSRRISDRIIEKFDLRQRFGTSKKSAVYMELEERTRFAVTEEGLLSVSATDRDPQMAADMATAYVEELIALNRDLLSSSAREKREFIEERLEDVKHQLESAREKLEQFQLRNRAVNLDEQTRLAIEQAVQLKVAQTNLELDIRMTEQVLGSENPELVDKRRRLSVILGQLDRLEWGGDDSSFFSLPVAAVPGLRGQFESLYARVKVNESLYQTLLELYEQARIQEEEDSPSISVLDWPAVPDVRSSPQRSFIVLTTFVCSLLFAVLLAALLEYLRRMKENTPDDYQRLLVFTNAFLGWLPGVRKSATQKL